MRLHRTFANTLSHIRLAGQVKGGLVAITFVVSCLFFNIQSSPFLTWHRPSPPTWSNHMPAAFPALFFLLVNHTLALAAG
jgi:hypothetical protein